MIDGTFIKTFSTKTQEFDLGDKDIDVVRARVRRFQRHFPQTQRYDILTTIHNGKIDFQ